ncbi:hypothetical protein [Rubritalea sp.]|uniref:hypothetical protein n=1 Tax=Rubritalea sp. TaxID=2109375 RepID=UPI003EF1B522
MKLLLGIIVAVVGIALISDGQGRVKSLLAKRELNPFDLRQSPYGEVIGAALQEPVHLLSHGGQGHEHMKSHEDCAGCSSCATAGHGHSHDHATVFAGKDRPWLAQRKSELAGLESNTRQNHNPKGRKAEARAFEGKRIWEIMELAYAMDPTNYANYNIYVELESREGGFEKILEISKKTLTLTEGRINDPNDALTAASAAETVLIYRDVYAKREGRENPDLEVDYKFFIEKTKEYAAAFDRALEEGRLQEFSQEKVDEMIQYYGRFNYTIKAYRKYIDERKLINVE